MKLLKLSIINFDMVSKPTDSFCNHWNDSEGQARIFLYVVSIKIWIIIFLWACLILLSQ